MNRSIACSALILLACTSCNVGDTSYTVDKPSFVKPTVKSEAGDRYYYVGVD